MLTSVKSRELPGALALGLLASLAAHGASFGSQHQVGGAYHGLLALAATAVAVAGLFVVGALAWGGAGRTADGSILGARISSLLPRTFPVLCFAAAWFGLVEWTEGAHPGGSALAIGLSLAAASWLVCAIARAALRCIAHAVVAIRRLRFASPRATTIVDASKRLYLYETPDRSRRFARPPPVAFARA